MGGKWHTRGVFGLVSRVKKNRQNGGKLEQREIKTGLQACQAAKNQGGGK